jgi:hypothetical protein
VSVAHFHGRFIFHTPLYNNDPSNQKVKFDANVKSEEVFKICGCDPMRYFDFIFRNVRINQVTYSDGTSTIDNNNDSILGQKIFLNGIMADVSPSAICGQLFATSLKVGNLLSGNLLTATQSDLRTNIRPLNSKEIWSQENAGAHFETILNLSDKTSPPGSRYLQELGNINELEFYMHLNQHTLWDTFEGFVKERLNGYVYGYIRPISEIHDEDRLRIKSRRIIAHPSVKENTKIRRAFIGQKSELTRNTDIDGSYDIFKNSRLLMLRYMDFIPFIDRCHNTPTDRGIVSEYVVLFINRNSEEQIEVGRIKGSYDEMQKTGGLSVLKLPDNLSNLHDLALLIKVRDNEGQDYPLMIESDFDIMLENAKGILGDKRGLTLGSNDNRNIIVRVYHKNRPIEHHTVRLLTQEQNRRSPIVAKFKQHELNTNQDGIIEAKVEAIDLEDCPAVYDPISEKELKGLLPWNRYYGNYVYIEIDNPMRIFQNPQVERIEIPVRVLHNVKPELIPTGEISFKRHIYPRLFEYYIRYFPWLHVIETEEETYIQFLNLESYCDSNGIGDNISEIITRLSFPDDDWRKMPRSRDLPIGGLELIRRWKKEGDKLG